MAYAAAVAFALFFWWFSTGLIFFLTSRPTRTYKRSMQAATAVAGLAVYGVWASGDDASGTGAYLAFASGLTLWGWHELSLYTGFVTGPRKHRCPHGCKGWAHLRHAIEANLWHEIAIVTTALLLVVLTWDAQNQLGTWTFLLVWWMHLSARLNVFLGVRNVSADLVPAHMEVLKGFLTQKPMNLLFPFSVTALSILAVVIVGEAMEATSAFVITSLSLTGALVVLALVEHWLLILPLPVDRLWQWWLARKPRAKEPTPSAELEVFEVVRAS